MPSQRARAGRSEWRRPTTTRRRRRRGGSTEQRWSEACWASRALFGFVSGCWRQGRGRRDEGRESGVGVGQEKPARERHSKGPPRAGRQAAAGYFGGATNESALQPPLQLLRLPSSGRRATKSSVITGDALSEALQAEGEDAACPAGPVRQALRSAGCRSSLDMSSFERPSLSLFLPPKGRTDISLDRARQL